MCSSPWEMWAPIIEAGGVFDYAKLAGMMPK